ncbi:MAG: tetratricopeptide repeat protein [Thermosphaera sp.]
MTIHSELKAQNPKPTTFASLRSNILLVAILLLLVLIVIVAVNPLLALYHQQQAGRALAQILPTSENEYGGFACLQPFIEDLDQRETLKAALNHLRKAENYAPRQSHTFYLQGKTWCLLGDYENAVQAFQRFSELRPKNPIGYLEMGFALLQACPPNGKCPDGLNTYDVWRKAGVRAEDFLVMAEKARQKEDWETALLWYQNAQRMGMELRSTVAYLRYLNLKRRAREREALKALEMALTLDKGWINWRIRSQAWLTYILQLSPADFSRCSMISCRKRAVAVWKEGRFTAQDFIQSGEEARLAQRYEEALRWYEMATWVEPGLADPWYYAGLAYEGMKRWEEALAAYEKAITLSSLVSVHLSSLYYRIGVVYQWGLNPRQLDAALRAYETAIALNDFKDNLEASDCHYKRGEVLRWMKGDPNEYIAEFELAIKLNPRHVFAHIFLGVAYYTRDKNVDIAEAEIKRAIQLSPQSKWAYYFLGEIYRLEGRVAEARMMYEKALELDPQFEVAQKGLQALK